MRITIVSLEVDEKDMDLNDIGDMMLDDELDIDERWQDDLWGREYFEKNFPDEIIGMEGDE